MNLKKVLSIMCAVIIAMVVFTANGVNAAALGGAALQGGTTQGTNQNNNNNTAGNTAGTSTALGVQNSNTAGNNTSGNTTGNTTANTTGNTTSSINGNLTKDEKPSSKIPETGETEVYIISAVGLVLIGIAGFAFVRSKRMI